MGIKSQIIEKCKTEKSRNVLLSQLALIERSVKENKVLDRVNGDEDLAIRTQLHWELHDLNGGGNKTYSVEHIAGLVGLILMTRAWDGYLTGTGVSSSMSFKAFLADNGLDLEHVQYCLDKCARELMEDFARACTMSAVEAGVIARNSQLGTITAAQFSGWDGKDPDGGFRRRNVRSLLNRATTDERAEAAYNEYLLGQITLTTALRKAGLKRSVIYDKASSCLKNLCDDEGRLAKSQKLEADKFLQFALNYVVDQFKEGIPPELLEKYVPESSPN